MGDYRIISSDGHIFEPPDLWKPRMKPEFRDRAPYIGKRDTGGEAWFCDGHLLVEAVVGGSQAGLRFEAPDQLSYQATAEMQRPGGWDPDEHVKDMDIDGIDVEIIYPSAGQNAYRVQDSLLLDDICRAYNDWIADFCDTHPKRLRGVGMINLDDIQVGVQEMQRCKKLGLAGVLITIYPPEDHGYHLPEYEPLWATAQDQDMPLGMHLVSNRPASYEFLRGTDPAFTANTDHWARRSIGQMIFSGVFERYPKLNVGAVEMEAAWAIHFLQAMDFSWTQRAQEEQERSIIWYQFKDRDMFPSDYFRQNVFISFQEDRMGIRNRDFIGVDTLLWGSDYPHPESTFPRSREVIDDILSDCTEEEKVKIVGGNAARIYGLN